MQLNAWPYLSAARSNVAREQRNPTLISEVHSRLAAKFAELPPQQVSRAVAEAQARLAQSSVRAFVPLLVERRADDDLTRQAETRHSHA